MTESQRRWEAWFAVFADLHQAWPVPAQVRCPGGGEGEFAKIVYIGDVERRIGTAFVWCDACRQGIALTRVGVPDGAPMLSSDTPQDEVDKVVPNDIEFLPPDPFSEGEEFEL